MRSTYITLHHGVPTRVCSIPRGSGQIVKNTGHRSTIHLDVGSQVDATGVALAPGDYFTFPGDAETPLDLWAVSFGAGEITVYTRG